ncbi:MAG: 2-C-methyl-D-erythritol 4-phosphate cytidylyltransferase, partial [bacterium]
MLRTTSTVCWRRASAQCRKQKQQLPEATPILAAAGSGERLGAGEPKALVELAGRPMYQWSLDAIGGAGSVTQVLVAVPEGLEDRVPASVGDKPVRAVVGGASRSESVSNALALVEEELVLIHDAARPLADAALFDRLVDLLGSDDTLAGAIVASPIVDTVKRVGEDESVSETIDRSSLRAAETPQAFRTGALRDAIASGPRDATDD